MNHRNTALIAVLITSVAAISACGGSSNAGSSTVASSCKPRHQLQTKDKGVLSVTGGTLMPFARITPTELGGVEGDILQEIAKMECVRLKAVPASAAAAIPSVQNGKVDISIGDWNRRVDRLALVDMSDPNFIDQMGLVSKDGIADVQQLKGKSVGSITGYGWNKDLDKILDGKLKEYPSNVQMYADLKNGRLDVAVDGYGPAAYTFANSAYKAVVATPNKTVGASLNPPPQSAFVLPKSGALTPAINEDLAALKKQGKIVAILEKYKLPASVADTGPPRAIK